MVEIISTIYSRKTRHKQKFPVVCNDVHVDLLNMDELKTVLKKSRNRKDPGLNNLTFDLFKNATDKYVERF